MTTPTKVIIGTLTVALIGGGFWFLNTGSSEVKFARVTQKQAAKAVEVLERDQDDDGLKDWEEDLWHTDQKNPDTDGDGTADGAEIKLGRNPAKASPEDELDAETIETKTVTGDKDWTETDRFSRELFAKYLRIKNSGAPFTAEDERALLEDFVGRYPEVKPAKSYTESDIILAKSDDVASLHAYGNALATVVEAHNDGSESEIVIFERALENEDEKDLASLEDRVKRYASMITGFKATPSPKSLVPIHLKLLNALEELRGSVEGMSRALTDSIHALSAASAYPPAVNNLTDAFILLASFLKEGRVTFGEEEPGYILMK